MEAPVILRTRSTGPRFRSGLALGAAPAWAVHEVAELGEAVFEKLLALVEDAKVQVQIGTPDAEAEDGFSWSVPPTADELRLHIGAGSGAVDVKVAVPIPPLILAGIQRQTAAVIAAITEGRMPMPTLEQIEACIAQLAAVRLFDDQDEAAPPSGTKILPPVEPTLEREADPHTPESKGDAESVSTVSSTPGAGTAEETAAPVADGETIAEPEPDPDTASRPKGKAKR